MGSVRGYVCVCVLCVWRERERERERVKFCQLALLIALTPI